MEFVLFAALIPTDWSEHVRSKEQVWLRAGLGEETADRVVARAERWYGTLFEDSGLVAATYRIVLPSSRELDRAGALSPLASLPLWSWADGRLDVVWNGVYQAIQRLVMFAVWWPFVLFLFTAAWGDGWARRRIRQSGFAYASPLAHAYALRGIAGIALALGLLLFLPVPLPGLGAPAAGAVLASLVSVAVSNAQKRL
jgi:hypothetical protein